MVRCNRMSGEYADRDPLLLLLLICQLYTADTPNDTPWGTGWHSVPLAEVQGLGLKIGW